MFLEQKTFGLIAGIIFGLIASLHFLRVFYDLEAVINGVIIPMWASWITIIISSSLSFWGFKYSK